MTATPPEDWGAPQPGRRRRLTPRQVQDLLSVVLVVASVTGLVVVAWSVDAQLGAAALFGSLLAVGVALGLDRDTGSDGTGRDGGQ